MELGRKLMFNGLVVFFNKGSIEQILAALLLSLIYLALVLYFQPYQDSTDDVVAGVAQLQLFMTLFLGLLIQMRAGEGTRGLDMDAISLFIVMSNAVAFISTVLAVLVEKRRVHRRAKRKARKLTEKLVKVHVRRLWRKAFYYCLVEASEDSNLRLGCRPGVFLEFRRRSMTGTLGS